MKRVLPIAIHDNPIVSECWTFAKTAIIKTSPYATDWLASHLQIYMDQTFCIYFGEGNDGYCPGYYDDILHAQNLNVFDINADNIIPVIKDNIDRGSYILLRTNWNIADIGEPRYHEVLIYGYDDERGVFLSPLMKDRIFVPAEIPFEHIKISHIPMLEELKKYPNRRLNASMMYQCPVVSYRLREDYSPDQCVYMAMDRLTKEIKGRQIVNSSIGDIYISGAHTCYSGIACFCGLETIIKMLVQGRVLEEHFPGLTNTLKKMHEYQSLILLALRYIRGKWRIEAPAVQEYIDVYADCCERLQQWRNMSLKYESNGDKNMLHRILDDTYHVCKTERTALQQFRDAAFKWFEEKNIS